MGNSREPVERLFHRCDEVKGKEVNDGNCADLHPSGDRAGDCSAHARFCDVGILEGIRVSKRSDRRQMMIEIVDVAQFLQAVIGETIVWVAGAIIALTALVILVFWFRDSTNRR